MWHLAGVTPKITKKSLKGCAKKIIRTLHDKLEFNIIHLALRILLS